MNSGFSRWPGCLGRALGLALACLISLGIVTSSPELAWAARSAIDLQQGWRPQEVELYHHRSSGINLAPLELALALPDPDRPGHHFLERLVERYGFIASAPSALNPHGLPVGLAVDPRPQRFGDRAYLGLTCAVCHTRELRARPVASLLPRREVSLAVHGAPGLVDLQAFTSDFYEAFAALASDGVALAGYASEVMHHPASAAEIEALKAEIAELLAPVLASRQRITARGMEPPRAGAGNFNALAQAESNTAGLKAWLVSRGLMSASQPAAVVSPLGLEGALSIPSLWFSPEDDWGQWFVKLHHPGVRNWIAAVTTSPVRPPRLAAALKDEAIVASVDFDGIEAIQDAISRLRSPLWPEKIFGRLQPERVRAGEQLFARHCSSCHATTQAPANALGRRFWVRRAFAVGTDPLAYERFAAAADARTAALQGLSQALLLQRHHQLLQRFSNDATLVARTELADSLGLPNRIDLASDASGGAGPAYWAPALEGVFATSPYLHNGSVRTLADLLKPPEQRPRQFHTGTQRYDPVAIGLRDEGPFLYDTGEPGKSAQGHDFGTALNAREKQALLDYLRSL